MEVSWKKIEIHVSWQMGNCLELTDIAGGPVIEISPHYMIRRVKKKSIFS